MFRFPSYAVDKFHVLGNDLHAQSKNVRLNSNVNISAANLEFLKVLTSVIDSTANTTYVRGTPRVVKTEMLLLIVERIAHLPPNQQGKAAMTIAKCMDVFSQFEFCISKKLSDESLGISLHALDLEFHGWVLQILTIPERVMYKQTVVRQIVAKLNSLFPDAGAERNAFQTCENESLQTQQRLQPNPGAPNVQEIVPVAHERQAFYINTRNQFLFLCREFDIRFRYGTMWSIEMIKKIADLVCGKKDVIAAALGLLACFDISRNKAVALAGLVAYICEWRKQSTYLPPLVPTIHALKQGIVYLQREHGLLKLKEEKTPADKKKDLSATQKMARQLLDEIADDASNSPERQAKFMQLAGLLKINFPTSEKQTSEEPKQGQSRVRLVRLGNRKGSMRTSAPEQREQRTRQEEGKQREEGDEDDEESGEEGDEKKEGKEGEELPDKKSNFFTKYANPFVKMLRQADGETLKELVAKVNEYVEDPVEASALVAGLIGLRASVQVDHVEGFMNRLQRYVREDVLGETNLPGARPKGTVLEKAMKLRPRINRLNFVANLVLISGCLFKLKRNEFEKLANIFGEEEEKEESSSE